MPRRAFISSVMRVSGNVNADIGVGTRIPMKKIYNWRQEVKAFVSARCIRRCIRERLAEKGFTVDPLTMGGEGAERQQLVDIGDPVRYVDDDIFGFLSPERLPRKRDSPVKVSPLISLHHTEVKVEFAARFPREFLREYEKGYPVPFEIEVAEWLGRLNVIVTDRVGRFDPVELKDEMKERSELTKTEDGCYQLSRDERRRRLKGLLEVLLWEGWQFPRASESPCTPEFYYAVVALTEHFTPIFPYVDVDENDSLNESKLNRMLELYGELIDEAYVVDYKGGELHTYRKSGDTLSRAETKKLSAETIKEVIEAVCRYVIT